MIQVEILEKAQQAIVEQDKEEALKLAQEILSAGENPVEMLNEGFIPGIQKVGDLFGRGILFLPELTRAADIMSSITDILMGAVSNKENGQGNGVIVMATVKGDIHDIGKCIVVSMLKAHGITVYDLGRDVETAKIINEAVKVNADVIGTSALLTTTMARQKELEVELKKAGLRDRFKTMVGGAPVTMRWAKKIGADAYAEDAQDAVVKIKELLKK